MNVTHVSLSDLSNALARVIPAVPPKSTLYVLEHVRLTADGDRLELTATDTELTISCHVPAHIAAGGAVLVPARKFYDVVRALPDDLSCELTVTDSKLRLKTAIGHYDFPILNADEFPELPEASHAASVTISSEDARMIAECVAYAASDEQYRPAMTGVKFELDAELVAVATDGYRLATLTLPLGTSGDGMHAIVPARVVQLLSKVDGDVTLGFGNTHAIIATATEHITTRLIDESYPQWRNVLPSDNTKLALIDRGALLKAIRRVALFTSAASQLVRFVWANDTLTLSVTDSETGAHAEEQLECTYSAEPLEIGFNHKYITEALAHLPSERVQLAFSLPTRAVLITPEKQQELRITKLVMPMRLS
jgi:DNA polymerase-3 subunit beta